MSAHRWRGAGKALCLGRDFMFKWLLIAATAAMLSACGPTPHPSIHPVRASLYANADELAALTEKFSIQQGWTAFSGEPAPCTPTIHFIADSMPVRNGWGRVDGYAVALNWVETANALASYIVVSVDSSYSSAMDYALDRSMTAYLKMHAGQGAELHAGLAQFQFRRAGKCVGVSVMEGGLSEVRDRLSRHNWTIDEQAAAREGCVAETVQVQLMLADAEIPTADGSATYGYFAGGTIFEMTPAGSQHYIGLSLDNNRRGAYDGLVDQMVGQFDTFYPSS